MIQPGLMFGGEGPMMTGTWYNPNTGDAFTVRDSFFEDNQYVVTTTDNRYFKYDQLQNYIQSDMKLEELKKMKIENKPEEKLPAEVSNLINGDDNYSDMILPEDQQIVGKPNNFGNINTNNMQAKDESPINTNMNSAIIEKALKNTVKPNFSINVEWPNYPSKEIEMLKDIMEIPSDEIVEWYLNNIQFNDFIMAFKNAIDEKIRFGNKSESIDAEVIKLPEPEEVIAIEVPTPDTSHEDDGALAKEPKKLDGSKSPRGGRKPANKKK